MVGLCTIGIMVIYSATHTSEAADLKNAAVQQGAWVGLGLACFFALAFLDYHRWVAQGWFWFGGGLCLLLLGSFSFGARWATSLSRWASPPES